MAEQRLQSRAGSWRRLRLRSPGRVLLVVALVSLLLGTHGAILSPIGRAFSLSCELLRLRSTHGRLAQQNAKLADVAAYLETDEGQELAARSELGAVRKGERLIVTTPPPPPATPPPATLSQLLHGWLTRGYEAVTMVAGYCRDLAGCLFGADDWAALPTTTTSEREGVGP